MTSEAYDTILFRMVCSECLLSKCSCLLLQLNASISSREDKLEIKFSWTHAVINIQCSYPRRSRLQLTISFFFFCKNIIIKNWRSKLMIYLCRAAFWEHNYVLIVFFLPRYFRAVYWCRCNKSDFVLCHITSTFLKQSSIKLNSTCLPDVKLRTWTISCKKQCKLLCMY